MLKRMRLKLRRPALRFHLQRHFMQKVCLHKVHLGAATPVDLLCTRLSATIFPGVHGAYL